MFTIYVSNTRDFIIRAQVLYLYPSTPGEYRVICRGHNAPAIGKRYPEYLGLFLRHANITENAYFFAISIRTINTTRFSNKLVKPDRTQYQPMCHQSGSGRSL